MDIYSLNWGPRKFENQLPSKADGMNVDRPILSATRERCGLPGVQLGNAAACPACEYRPSFLVQGVTEIDMRS